MKKLSIGIIGTGRFASVLKMLFANDPRSLIKQSSRTAKIDGRRIFSFSEVSGCEIIIPTVPIFAMKEVIQQLSVSIPRKNHPLVMSVCSVMKEPEQWLREGLGERADLLVTHPLFGPQSTQHGKVFQDLRWVWNPVQISKSDRLDHLKVLLQKRELQLVQMSSDDHDQIMAKTQWMSFLFGQLGTALELKETELDTQGFRHLLQNQSIVESDSDELFFDLCVHNVHAQKQLRNLDRILKTHVQHIHSLIEQRSGNDQTPTLQSLRKEINALDDQLLFLLSQRMRVVKKVGNFKKQRRIAPLQPSRWQEVLQRLHQQSSEFDLAHSFIDDVWNRIHDEALQIEKQQGEV